MSISKEKGQYYQEKWEELQYKFANIEMKEEIERLQEENKHLNLQLDQALKDYEELYIKIDKPIEYTKSHTDKLKTIRVPKIDFDYSELLEILGEKE